VRLWDLRTGAERVLATDTADRVLALAFSRDGETLAAGLLLKPAAATGVSLKAWDVATGEEPCAFTPAPQGPTLAVAFAPGDRVLASSGPDGRVLLWDRAAGKSQGELRVGVAVTGLAYAPGGVPLVVSGHNPKWKGVQCWDPGRGLHLDGRATEAGPCRCVAFAPGGKLLAFANGPRVVLWRMDLGRGVAELTGHQNDVLSLAFSADGGVLVTGGADQQVRLWDVRRYTKDGP
jgi:WD40 repeat protein